MTKKKKDPEYVKNKELKVRLSNKDLEKLDNLANWAKMNRSETIRSLIKEAENYYILTR